MSPPLTVASPFWKLCSPGPRTHSAHGCVPSPFRVARALVVTEMFETPTMPENDLTTPREGIFTRTCVGLVLLLNEMHGVPPAGRV